MWAGELISVVVENKIKNTFYRKSLWDNEEINIIIQFAECFRWGAVELSPEQYELIEEESYDTDTYDTHYNTNSRYEIKTNDEILFMDSTYSLEVEFCKLRIPAENYSKIDICTLEAMSDFSWFEENYLVKAGNIMGLDDALLDNSWKFIGNSYLINGDISVTRKSEYDYLWTSNSNSNSGENAGNKGLYGERIDFLNNQEED